MYIKKPTRLGSRPMEGNMRRHTHIYIMSWALVFTLLAVVIVIVTRESSTAKIVRRRIPSRFLVSTTSITRPLQCRLAYVPQLWTWGTVRTGSTLVHDTVPVGGPVHVYLVYFLNPLYFITAFVRPRGKFTTSFSESSQHHEGKYAIPQNTKGD